MQSIQHSNVTNLSRTHHIEAALTKLFLLLAQKYFVCMVVFLRWQKFTTHSVYAPLSKLIHTYRKSPNS